MGAEIDLRREQKIAKTITKHVDGKHTSIPKGSVKK